MKKMPDTFSIDVACFQISPFKAVYRVSGPFLKKKKINEKLKIIIIIIIRSANIHW